ncbi:MAG: OmpW/AlkL family protein [Anaeromyxobacteraceae bacterium]
MATRALRRRSRWTATRVFVPLVCAICTVAPARGAAQAVEGSAPLWTVRTRAVMSGSSNHSDPAGYKVYSGIGVEAGVARQLGSAFAVEFTARTESREVDVNLGAPTDTRLGAIELLPLGLMVAWSPRAAEKTLRPYLGAGANLTLCWEKSGALDDTQLSPSVSPAVQLGLDVALSWVLALNLEVKWNLLRTDVTERGARLARLEIDPLTLGLGVAIRL